jgi:dTDP-4-amino-4,6-dideoxygalactose transaminase
LSNGIVLPALPAYATNNAHMFYLLCPSLEYRTVFMDYMKEKGVVPTFHYLPLHSSAYYKDKHDGRKLPNCDRYGDTLVRLPLYYELEIDEVENICQLILSFEYNQ